MSGSTTFNFVNNFSTTISASIGQNDTTITLNSELNANPTTFNPIVLTFNDKATGTFYEIVHVVEVNGKNLTIVRGQEGTAPLSWAAGDYAFSGPTAGQMENFIQSPEMSEFALKLWVSENFASITGNSNQSFQVAPASQGTMAPQWQQVQEAIAAGSSPTSFINVGSGELLTVPSFKGMTIATVFWPSAGSNITINLPPPSDESGPILFIASNQGFEGNVGTVSLGFEADEFMFALPDGSQVYSITLDQQNANPYYPVPLCTIYSSLGNTAYSSAIIHTRPIIMPAVANNQAARFDQVKYANFSTQYITSSGSFPSENNVVTEFIIESESNISLTVNFPLNALCIISNPGPGSLTLTASSSNMMFTQDGNSTTSFTINASNSSTTLLVPGPGGFPVIVPLANPIILPATEDNQAAQWGQVQTAISALANGFSGLFTGDGGYAKIPYSDSPSGYLIFQWGQELANSNSTNLKFPIAFPTACFRVFSQEAVGSTSAGIKVPYIHTPGNYTNDGCTVYSCSWNTSANEWSGSATGTIAWIALGN